MAAPPPYAAGGAPPGGFYPPPQQMQMHPQPVTEQPGAGFYPVVPPQGPPMGAAPPPMQQVSVQALKSFYDDSVAVSHSRVPERSIRKFADQVAQFRYAILHLYYTM